MKVWIPTGLLLLCIPTLVRAAETTHLPETPAGLVEELIQSVGAMNTLLADIKDEAGMATVKGRLTELLTRGAAISEALGRMREQAPEALAKEAKGHEPEMLKAVRGFAGHFQRLSEFESVKVLFETPEFQMVGAEIVEWTIKPIRGDPRGSNHLLAIEETPDRQPAFRFDHTEPFHLELGRGSGWRGLETTSVNEKGEVVLYRMAPNGGWKTAQTKLPAEALTAIWESLNNQKILTMGRMYSATGVNDGTQWVFWLKQGEREKSIYFNNHFPDAIQDFAVHLDDLLTENGLGNATWTDVPAGDARKHEDAIWASIRDSKPTK